MEDEGRGVTAPGSIVPRKKSRRADRQARVASRRWLEYTEEGTEEIVGEVGVEEGERGPRAAGSDVWEGLLSEFRNFILKDFVIGRSSQFNILGSSVLPADCLMV